MIKNPDNTSSKTNPVGRFMVAAGAIIELRDTGKILIIQRDNKIDWQAGDWEICYGRIAQFEDLKTGLKREVAEEVGIKDIEILDVTRVWHMFRGTERAENELIGITFHCKTNTEEVLLSKEHSRFQWLLPEQALEIIKNEGIKQDIIQFIEARNKVKG
jgi:8-oxo-dGTP pyrophosphatase MutT (NUDIX family)